MEGHISGGISSLMVGGHTSCGISSIMVGVTLVVASLASWWGGGYTLVVASLASWWGGGSH